ncbi:MAG: Do family serine endopeptidase [Gemmatimonadaceae bacterium]|nr:Do family serine endopeptidase [Gemmatimonadaceae bacterium]
MVTRLNRTKILIAATVAFVGGIIFASSMDWTDRIFAQGSPAQQAAPKPRNDEVRTIAEASNAFVSIAEYITPAVVSIQAERDRRARNPRGRQQVPPGFEEFFRIPEGQQQPQEATGSGFVVSRDGYILTNNHVVEGADRVKVALQDRRVFDAKIIGRDPTTDVAVLKIEGRNFTPLSFGDDESLRIGEWVLAIGNPLGLDFTVTAGIVSAKGRGLPGLNPDSYAITDFIQTDAAINPGNSGGPLVNSKGEVVGINTAIASQTGFYSGYGFAIPITLAKQVMDDLIEHGEVRRAVLGVGINEVTPEDAQVAGLRTITGVKIGGYSGEDSPAQRAGLEPGDIITKIDGKSVDRVSALQRAVRAKAPGETVELEAWRYGSRKTFRVRLAAAPSSETTVAEAVRQPEEPATTSRLGISVEPVPSELVNARRIPEQYRGLRVAAVDPAGPAADNRLVVNDVIAEVLYPQPKTRVSNSADLQRVLDRMKPGEILSLLVFRGVQGQGGGTVVVNLRTN